MDLFMATLLEERVFSWILFLCMVLYFHPRRFCGCSNLLSCLLLLLKISPSAGRMKEAGCSAKTVLIHKESVFKLFGYCLANELV